MRSRHSVTIRRALLVALGLTAIAHAPATAEAEGEVGESARRCGGTVFHDAEPDGRRSPTEPGVAGVRVDVTDRLGASETLRTDDRGDWSTTVPTERFPIRIVVTPPPDRSSTLGGSDHRGLTRLVDSITECGDGVDVGLLDQTRRCTGAVEFVTSCFVMADAPHLASAAAVVAIGANATDRGSTASTAGMPWIDGPYRVLATHAQVGTVWGQAVGRDGTVYASSFTKRHTRSRSDLNPEGNPTTIFRIRPDGVVERLTTVDPGAAAPRATADEGDRHDLTTMDLVYTSGLGDLEISPDGDALYTVDLGRRLLVELDPGTGTTRASLPLDGPALAITDCATSASDPFGDLRPFGLGWDGDRLLVGIVCSAESTVDRSSLPIAEQPGPGTPLGDHDALVGYVFELTDSGLVERLRWPLAGDRGNTYSNGLLSNDAAWHPWIPVYPYVAEHDFVSYPQPAITGLEVAADDSLVIALGDRWGHQTGPVTLAPRLDGTTAEILEPVIAGDLQRACPSEDGWVIEGSAGCEGGLGNDGEYFDGERYGWHDETALGAVTSDPRTNELVITQMDPIPDDGAWRSGGIAGHDLAGAYASGVRLFDGRDADPDHTFEKASGLGDLEALCDGPTAEIGGLVWLDDDRDGELDPTEPTVDGVTVELHRDGDVIATALTDTDGWYLFRENELGRAARTGTFEVTIPAAGDNADVFGTDGALAGAGPTVIRHDLQRPIATRALSTPAGAMSTVQLSEVSIDHAVHFGYRHRHLMSIETALAADADLFDGRIEFVVTVRNVGGVQSGPFTIENHLPPGTELIEATPAPTAGESQDLTPGDIIRWQVDESVAPGEAIAVRVAVRSVSSRPMSITNEARLTDLQQGSDTTESSDTASVELSNIVGAVGVGSASAAELPPGDGTTVTLVDDQIEAVAHTSTDDRGGFAFRHVPPGSYRLVFGPPALAPGQEESPDPTIVRLQQDDTVRDERVEAGASPMTATIHVDRSRTVIVDVTIRPDDATPLWRLLVHPIPLLALGSAATCLVVLAARYRRGRYPRVSSPSTL